MSDELVVNLHVTERCNFKCGFCYGHWEKNGKEIFNTKSEAVELIASVYDWVKTKNNIKVRFNFVGGEPGLIKNLSELIVFCKSLGARVSFVSNGLIFKKLSPQFIAEYVDIIGISIDSALACTNQEIGRATESGKTLKLNELYFHLSCIRENSKSVMIKLNTVVSKYNKDEYMGDVVSNLSPEKWKIFQALPVYTNEYSVSDDEFNSFIYRHSEFEKIIVSENNDEMTNSYLMIDPQGRFFQRDTSKNHGYIYSENINKVGVERAFSQQKFDIEKYKKRYEKVAI